MGITVKREIIFTNSRWLGLLLLVIDFSLKRHGVKNFIEFENYTEYRHTP